MAIYRLPVDHPVNTSSRFTVNKYVVGNCSDPPLAIQALSGIKPTQIFTKTEQAYQENFFQFYDKMTKPCKYYPISKQGLRGDQQSWGGASIDAKKLSRHKMMSWLLKAYRAKMGRAKAPVDEGSDKDIRLFVET